MREPGESGSSSPVPSISGPAADRLVTLAGPLPQKGPGARGLSQLALNADCDRVLVIRAAGVEPEAVLAHAYGDAAQTEGSRIAYMAGVAFERQLTRDEGAALFQMYRDAGRLSAADRGFVNLTAEVPGKDAAALAKRERLTRALLLRKLEGDPAAPAFVWHPRLSLRVFGRVIPIEPDYLVGGGAQRFYRPGEVKAQRDRGARTSLTDLARARYQGAVEVLALRDTLLLEGAGEVAALVPAVFDLVLRRRLGMKPSLRESHIERELAVLQRILSDADERVRASLARLPQGATLAERKVVERIPFRFDERCHEHCALATRCEAAARAAGEPAVLGRAVAEALGGRISIPRLVALAEGREVPATADEAHLVREFTAARATLAAVDRRAHRAV